MKQNNSVKSMKLTPLSKYSNYVKSRRMKLPKFNKTTENNEGKILDLNLNFGNKQSKQSTNRTRVICLNTSSGRTNVPTIHTEVNNTNTGRPSDISIKTDKNRYPIRLKFYPRINELSQRNIMEQKEKSNLFSFKSKLPKNKTFDISENNLENYFKNRPIKVVNRGTSTDKEKSDDSLSVEKVNESKSVENDKKSKRKSYVKQMRIKHKNRGSVFCAPLIMKRIDDVLEKNLHKEYFNLRELELLKDSGDDVRCKKNIAGIVNYSENNKRFIKELDWLNKFKSERLNYIKEREEINYNSKENIKKKVDKIRSYYVRLLKNQKQILKEQREGIRAKLFSLLEVNKKYDIFFKGMQNYLFSYGDSVTNGETDNLLFYGLELHKKGIKFTTSSRTSVELAKEVLDYKKSHGIL